MGMRVVVCIGWRGLWWYVFIVCGGGGCKWEWCVLVGEGCGGACGKKQEESRNAVVRETLGHLYGVD